MAVALDAVTTANSDATTSLTWSHTCSGQNRGIAIINCDESNSNIPTYAGVNVSTAGSVRIQGAASKYPTVRLSYLYNPASGANDVVATNTFNENMYVTAISVTGASQVTTFATGASASGTSTAPSVTVASSVDDFVVTGVAWSRAASATATVGAGITERSNVATGADIGGASGTMPGSASNTAAWTLSGSTEWASAILTIKPYVAAAAPTVFGHGTAATASAATIAWPASHAVNDIGICVIETSGSSATLTPSNGWAHVTGSPFADIATTAGSYLQVLWKRATSTAEGSISYTSGDHTNGRITAFRGCVTTGSPFDGIATQTSTTAATTFTYPSITTQSENTRVVMVATRPNDLATTTSFTVPTNANLASIAEAYEGGTATGNGGGVQMVTGTKATAGATGTSGTVTNLNSCTNARMVFALRANYIPDTLVALTNNSLTVTAGRGDVTVAAGETTVPLTNNSLTMTAAGGSLVEANSVALTNNSLTVTAGRGDVTPDLSQAVPLTNNSLTVTAAGGTSVAGNAPALVSSVAVTATGGSVTYAVGATEVALISSVAVTAAGGTFSAAVTVALGGQFATSGYGSLTGLPSVVLGGSSVVVSAGTPGKEASAPLPGRSSVVSGGSIAVAVDGTVVALTNNGLAATASQGWVTFAASSIQLQTAQALTLYQVAPKPVLGKALTPVLVPMGRGAAVATTEIPLRGIASPAQFGQLVPVPAATQTAALTNNSQTITSGGGALGVTKSTASASSESQTGASHGEFSFGAALFGGSTGQSTETAGSIQGRAIVTGYGSVVGVVSGQLVVAALRGIEISAPRPATAFTVVNGNAIQVQIPNAAPVAARSGAIGLDRSGGLSAPAVKVSAGRFIDRVTTPPAPVLSPTEGAGSFGVNPFGTTPLGGVVVEQFGTPLSSEATASSLTVTVGRGQLGVVVTTPHRAAALSSPAIQLLSGTPAISREVPSYTVALRGRTVGVVGGWVAKANEIADSEAQQLALEQQTVAWAFFVEMKFNSGTQRICNFNKPFVWGGSEWTGLGGMVSISEMKSSEKIEPNPVNLSLNIAQASWLAFAVGAAEEYRGLPVTIYQCPLTPQYQLIGTPVVAWEGEMDVISVSIDGEDGSIAMRCEPGIKRLRRTNPARVNAAQHKAKHPADTGLDFQSDLLANPQTWLTKRFQQR